MIFFQIFIQILWNITWFFTCFVNIFTTGLFDNIDISYEFTIFTDWEMEWCDFFAI